VAVNRYAANCITCGGRVPAKGGILTKPGRRYVVQHLACAESGEPEVTTFRLSSGVELYQNRNGRCEDAPCCGCCTC